MKKLLALSFILSSAALTGCACLGIGSSGEASGGSSSSTTAVSSKSATYAFTFGSKRQTIELDIKFETGKADIAPLYDHQLLKVKEFMEMYPDSSAEIEGYADVTGDAESNKALSLSRAEAVRSALVQRHHCDATRLSSAGYGERPLIGTGSVAELAANRRVLATFSGKKAR